MSGIDRIQTITDDLAIAGQLSAADLAVLTRAGYRAVMNLRSPEETGVWQSEADAIQPLGLQYLHRSLPHHLLSPTTVLPLLEDISALPKPLVLHCDNGIRSAILALIYLAVKQGCSIDWAFQRVFELELMP